VMFFFVPNLWLLMPIHGLLAIVAQRTVVLENRTSKLFSPILSSREVTIQSLPLDDSPHLRWDRCPEGFWAHSRPEKLGIVIPRERKVE